MYEVLVVVGVPVLRSVAGWLQKALEDNKITSFEYKQLLSTVLRLGVPGLALYYGMEVPAEVAATIPLLVDYVYSLLKKAVK